MSWIDLREFTYDVVTVTTHGDCDSDGGVYHGDPNPSE